MIIDGHAHVFADPKIRPQPEATTYMSVGEQLAVMDRMGIDKAVILPLNNPESFSEFQSISEVLNICRDHPGRFIPFCNFDPRLTSPFYRVDAAYFEFILNQFKELGCKGLGEVTAKIYWDEPVLGMLFEACEKVGFPVTFHTTISESLDYGLLDETGFPRFEKILQKFPTLVFFAHSQSFWTEISGDFSQADKWDYPKGSVKSGGAVKRLMRKYPQLYGDLSANSGFNALARDSEHAYEFIDEFQERLIFGLDYCSVRNERRHIDWLRAARDQGRISGEAYEKIMWKNINRVLRLNIV